MSKKRKREIKSLVISALKGGAFGAGVGAGLGAYGKYQKAPKASITKATLIGAGVGAGAGTVGELLARAVRKRYPNLVRNKIASDICEDLVEKLAYSSRKKEEEEDKSALRKALPLMYLGGGIAGLILLNRILSGNNEEAEGEQVPGGVIQEDYVPHLSADPNRPIWV